MGSSATCYLPNDVRVDDVCDVVARLIGEKGKLDEHPWGTPFQQRRVKARVLEAVPTMLHIDLGDGRYLNYHFEGKDFYGKPCRLLTSGSTPWACGVFRGVAEFFGGWVEYDDGKPPGDLTNKEVFISKFSTNSPDDGKEWQRFEFEKFMVEKAKDMPEVAAYK